MHVGIIIVLVVTIILFIIIVIGLIIYSQFIQRDQLMIACTDAIPTPDPLPLPIDATKYSSAVANSLMQIAVAITEFNCPNLVLPLPAPFDQMEIIYGTNPITQQSTMFAVYFYSQQYNTGAIVFSGTAFTSEFIEDFNYSQVPPAGLHNLNAPGLDPLVHKGFYEIYMSIRNQIFQIINARGGLGSYTQFIVTGHSLGGALSTLAAIDLYNPSNADVLIHYSFASPRVGNIAFAQIFNSLVTESRRVYNTEDIVPTLPPAVYESYIYDQTQNGYGFTLNLGTLDNNHTQAYLEYLKNSAIM